MALPPLGQQARPAWSLLGDAASAAGAGLPQPRGPGSALSKQTAFSSHCSFLPSHFTHLKNFLEASSILTHVLQAEKGRAKGKVPHTANMLRHRLCCSDWSPPRCRDPQGRLPQPRATAQQPAPPKTDSPLKRIINFQLRSASFPLCNCVFNCRDSNLLLQSTARLCG